MSGAASRASALDPIAVELFGDDLAHVADLLAPLRERLLAEGAEVVDVEERHAEHLARARVDVAGHADVDDEQRPSRARLHHRFDRTALHEELLRTGRDEQHVAGDQRVGDLVEGDRTAVDPGGELVGLGRGAVGDDDLLDARPRERQRHALAHGPGAEHQDAAVVERAEPGRWPAPPQPTRPTPRGGRYAVSVRARLPTSTA